MRDFQNYTQEHGAARRRRWLRVLPVFLVATVLAIGVGAWAGVLGGTSDLDAEGGPGSGGERVDLSPAGLVQKLLGDGGGVPEGPLNVLVVGVDERPDRGDEETGSRTDTIMLVQVVPETGRVKLLSVPRDLLVEVEPGVEDRINAAYNYGGIEQTMTALENYAEIPIEHYAIVDFQGFSEVIQAIGGVKVDVGEDQFPEKWKMGEGVQKLGGRKALFYARYRGTPGGDLDRIERQQQLVAALRSKALRWDTVKTMPKTLTIINENVETDLDLEDAVYLTRILIRQGRHTQMTAVQLKGTPETLPNGNQVLAPDDAANENLLDDFRY